MDENDYIELKVTNVRKLESDCRHCVVYMQPNDDVREFVFFTDEYNAARIALRAFPDKTPPVNVSLWSEFTVNALDAFDIKVKDILVIRGKDEMFRTVIVMNNKEDGRQGTVVSGISDGVLMALSSGVPVKMDRKLFEDVSSVNDDSNKIKLPITLLPRKIIENRLSKAVETENYELASVLRDELKRRDSRIS